MYVFHTGPKESCHMNRDAYRDLVWAGDTTAYREKIKKYQFSADFHNRIFILLFVALCLPAKLTDLFVC